MCVCGGGGGAAAVCVNTWIPMMLSVITSDSYGVVCVKKNK